jgi:hypothetical protein
MAINKIRISTVTGDKDKQLLKGCYFLPNGTPGNFNFYDTKNNLLATSRISGSPIVFFLDNHIWMIDKFVITDELASGDWKNNDDTDPAEEGGSFQAQAGGTVEMEASAASAVATTNDHIKIHRVFGSKDKDMLTNCYFLPAATAGWYNFYDKNNNLLAGPTNQTTFSFILNSFNWTISNFSISSTTASGLWSNDDPNPTAEEGGSFQAQAGGTLDEESASAATA